MNDLEIEALVGAARSVGEKKLTWGNSGNFSVRLRDDKFAISASGTTLGDLDKNHVVVCDSHGTKVVGEGRASVETFMHAAIYRTRLDVNSVLHASPFFATMLAASTIEIEANYTTDTAYYVRTVRRVPFYSPGSEQLALASAKAARDCDVLILDHHGAVALGVSPEDAARRMEALEFLCRMLSFSALGLPLRPLSREVVQAFLESLSAHGAV